jgi:hypothetical protein
VVGRGLQVRPLSEERMSRTVCEPLFRISVKTSTSVPSGSTTIWLPIVWAFGPGS